MHSPNNKNIKSLRLINTQVLVNSDIMLERERERERERETYLASHARIIIINQQVSKKTNYKFLLKKIKNSGRLYNADGRSFSCIYYTGQENSGLLIINLNIL